MNKFFILFFFLIFFNHSSADDKIIYLDVNFLLTESEAGKYINKELQRINNINIEEFKKIETSIKSDEENLLKQKNILKEEDYNLKIKDLKSKYNSYQKLKNLKNSELKEIRDESANQVLSAINLILADYSKKNQISLIIEKKNIVIGKTELDVTKDILDLLNQKIQKVELKKWVIN